MFAAHIEVKVSDQELTFFDDAGEQWVYAISTARAGVGCTQNSYQTPLGKHIIAEKIGEGVPEQGVFVGRVFTGEIYDTALAAEYPERDWILTRILWLAGLEPGLNAGGVVDTQSRFIYIHGTPHTEELGTPQSHGCIRMASQDIIELFDKVSVGTGVEIYV